MNAVERIEAAIAKLEALKASSIPGPWSAPKELLGLPNKTIFGGNPTRTHAAYVAVAHDGELIVTLHRTIDAQLAILRAGHETEALLRSFPYTMATVFHDQRALDLADAILGGDPYVEG